jgi:hypothetical protein
MSTNIDTLLNELSSFNISTPAITRTPEPDLTEDKVTDFVVKSAGALVNAGLGSVNDLRELVVQGQNPDEIAALASLISSTAGAIEALNKLTLLNKKNQASKELKQMEIEGKKQIASLAGSNPGNGNTFNNTTNVLVASREEIIKQFLNDTTPVVETVALESNEPVQDSHDAQVNIDLANS